METCSRLISFIRLDDLSSSDAPLIDPLSPFLAPIEVPI